MAVRYLCDSCGFHGLDAVAEHADQVLCEVCGEPVLEDPDAQGSPPGRERPVRRPRPDTRGER